MARPDSVRRVKSYSAADGYVYQYYFYEVNRVRHSDEPAIEFVYVLSTDRSTTFKLRILVMEGALAAWADDNGRRLTGSEEYAVAKMRLFEALDQGEVPQSLQASNDVTILVDGSNLETFLQQLNI